MGSAEGARPDRFGVTVKGESMAGRDIHDGDTVWVDQGGAYAIGDVVLAIATNDDGERIGLVLKTFGGDCLLDEPATGVPALHCRSFKVIAVAFLVTRTQAIPPSTSSYGCWNTLSKRCTASRSASGTEPV